MSGTNSGYSPLPLSNSDSDCCSEEELHISQGNRIVNRLSKAQNIKTEKIINGQPNVINYKLIEDETDVGTTLVQFQNFSDKVTIVKPYQQLHLFSTTRKICFILSLLLCVLTTIVFIWFLPCDEGNCFSVSHKSNAIFWTKTLEGLELYGPINLVFNEVEKTQNLIILTRKISNYMGSNIISEVGMISLKGENGEKNWNISFRKKALDIDCKLIDINSDGINDCLIIGIGMLKAIDSISGVELWDIEDCNGNNQNAYLLDFPLIIYDLDGDEVNDLLISCSLPNAKKQSHLNTDFQNNMVFISGKTGKIINNPLKIELCSAIHSLMLEKNIVSYICYNSTQKESLQTISLLDLIKSVNKISNKILNFSNFEVLYQHSKNSNSAYTNGFRLLIENQGSCPEKCNIIIELKNEKITNKSLIVYSHKDQNVFGMKPVVSKLKNGKLIFAFKTWKWLQKLDKTKTKLPQKKILKVEKNLNSKVREKNNKFQSFETLDNVMLLESDSKFLRIKRAVYNEKHIQMEQRKVSNLSNLNMHIISETLYSLIFTLDNNHFHIKNITKDKIIQICETGQLCQPDCHDMKRSMVISDINGDGKEELVSFSSKFVYNVKRNSNTSDDIWQIRSVIRVINL